MNDKVGNMDATVGQNTCILHQATIIDATVRLFHAIIQRGIHLDDLADRNTVLQLQPVDSEEVFCSSPTCPFRHRLYIDRGRRFGTYLSTDTSMPLVCFSSIWKMPALRKPDMI